MITLHEAIARTERRFKDRQAERAKNARLIEKGKIIEANPPELVARRMARLQADGRMVRAMIGEGLNFAPSGPGVSGLGYPRALERVLGTNDLMGVGFFEGGLRAARSVARVHIRNLQGSPEGFGTGFMVSPRLLLTNNHVFGSPDGARASLAEFNFQVGPDGQMTRSNMFAFAPDDFFLTNEDMDFTLVAMRADSAVAPFGWLRLIPQTGKLMVGEKVNIIQHPNGEPKQIAIRENLVVDELDLFLHYKTDTAPGSSGSPVFNDQWEVVALHHSGVPQRDAQGAILTTDGRRWEQWMGEQRIAWISNEGARVSKIVAHMQEQKLSGEQRALRAEMFEKEPPRVVISPEADPKVPADSEADPPSRPVFDENGAAVWTIPVKLSVAIGGAASVTARVVSDRTGGSPTTTPDDRPKSAVVSPEPPKNLLTGADADARSELRAALAEAEAAKARTYYDKAADEAAAQDYYNGIRTTGGGRKLFEALSKLVEETHKTRFSYKPALHVYPWVDLHPDRRIHSVYSGQKFDAETLIEEDFKVAELRDARLRELKLTESVLGPEKLQQEIDLLEAALPFNCEHVVPQSWFAKREPMRGDLHHLFACETRCNSFRGNTAYFDFPDFEEVVRDDCGKRETNGFEPQAGKGPVARATLYFLLRYRGVVGDTGGELSSDRLGIVLDWHKNNPVDEYERHRNAAIFEKQGNRNPLIDHPDWTERIDFSLGFG